MAASVINALQHQGTHILELKVSVTTYDRATRQVVQWARNRESRYVCVSNVHVAMEAHDSESYREVVNGADLVTSDGMPLVWALRLRGFTQATRVYGPTLTRHILAAAAEEGIPVGFYGSAEQTVRELVQSAVSNYAGLQVRYAFAPPFRDLTPEEDRVIVQQIADSGIGILFVGLGCPRQERWMAAHRGQIRATMLGVGAAFDFIAGVKAQAPLWIQNVGMEWFFRLVTEPRRLWARYLKQNPRFLGLLVKQQLAIALNRGGRR